MKSINALIHDLDFNHFHFHGHYDYYMLLYKSPKFTWVALNILVLHKVSDE